MRNAYFRIREIIAEGWICRLKSPAGFFNTLLERGSNLFMDQFLLHLGVKKRIDPLFE
jgi:hypothetical protein